MALYTKRPLYPITCGKSEFSTSQRAFVELFSLLTCAGDNGTDPRKVEQNLEKHFTLAHKWGCVLLLDEADVFLAKRDVST